LIFGERHVGAPVTFYVRRYYGRHMSRPTESELLFEAFCGGNGIPYQRVTVGTAATPDYLVTFGPTSVFVEIKQIDADTFRRRDGVSSRQVGQHIRRKIGEARKQMRSASAAGRAAILLVHNNLDPLQLFWYRGTRLHLRDVRRNDGRAGDGRVIDSSHGRNAKLRVAHNSAFSAIGHLFRARGGVAVSALREYLQSIPP
jgi:hypothetical protein